MNVQEKKVYTLFLGVDQRNYAMFSREQDYCKPYSGNMLWGVLCS